MTGERVLTLRQMMLLGELDRGVARKAKMRYYQRGQASADNPMVCVLRAFSRDGGGFWPDDADIRDAYVWTSGFTERWFKVSDLLTALENLSGVHGLDSPMARIEEA